MRNKSHVALALALCLALAGCYFQYDENSTPAPTASPTAAASAETPVATRPNNAIYAQGVNVSHGGLLYRINSATVTKDVPKLMPGSPFAEFMKLYHPPENFGDDVSYMIVNQTVTNPHGQPCEFSPVGARAVVTLYESNGKIAAFPRPEDPGTHGYSIMYAATGREGPYWGLWGTRPLAPREAITADVLYVFKDASLEQNLYLDFCNAQEDNSIETIFYVVLHTVEENAIPSTPITQDDPPPNATPRQYPPEEDPKPFPLSPGQILEPGKDVEMSGMVCRVNSAEIIEDFQGLDWFPRSAYEETAAFMFLRGQVPCALLVNMTLANPTDAPLAKPGFNGEMMTMNLWLLDENNAILGNDFNVMAYDLRPYAKIENSGYWFYPFEPREELSVNYLFIGDAGDAGKTFCLTRSGFGDTKEVKENAKFIKFNAREAG